jgi:hypothetical protein
MNKEYIFTLTNVEVNILGKGLGELPFKEVSALILKLNKQLEDQQKEIEDKSIESVE